MASRSRASDVWTISVLMAFLLSSGCALLKASPAPETRFVPRPELLAERRERAPFHGYWVFDPIAYYEIRKTERPLCISEIDISNVIRKHETRTEDEKLRTKRIEEARELARYFRERIRIELSSSPNLALKIVPAPEPTALVVRIALTDIEPTDPGVNVVGTVAGFFIPGGGLIKSLGEGSVAMEGYVDEADTRNVFEEYKDREGQQISPFSIKDYQRYAHVRSALDEWARQIAELLTSPPDRVVKDSAAINLSPL